MEQYIEKAIENYRNVLETVSPRIKEAIDNGKHIQITTLAKDMAGQFDVEWDLLYSMLHFFVQSNKDGLEVRRGPSGGIGAKTKE